MRHLDAGLRRLALPGAALAALIASASVAVRGQPLDPSFFDFGLPGLAIEPGGPDRGQPTHFYPRRSPFLFTVKLPKDFGDKELIWTLTTNVKTERAYASLKTDYQIDNQVISTEVGGDFGSLRDELRTNITPELRVEGEAHRAARVGEPITLTAFAGDPDNLPARRDGKSQPRHADGRMAADTEAAPKGSPAAAPRAAGGTGRGSQAEAAAG